MRVVKATIILITLLRFFARADDTLTPPKIDLQLTDRILVLAPHPDDEVLGCGGVMQKALAKKLPVKVVFLTYGDNNEWSFLVYRKYPVLLPKAAQKMGLVRHNEALAAASTLGISQDNLIFLGYPDFRTLDIWAAHWGKNRPEKSMLTEVRAVPYRNAFRPGALYKGDEILKDIKTIIREFKPTKIFLSHPADHNPDHLSLYLFTRIALWDLDHEIRPKIYPYLIHYPFWPVPRGYHPEKNLIPVKSFKEILWEALNLNTEEVLKKNAALQKHKSQYGYNKNYLASFIRTNELFGDFPMIKLLSNTPLTVSLLDDNERLAEQPEDLSEEERALFVGIEERSFSLKDGQLIINLGFSRPLGEAVVASVYVFGYRKDVLFAKMPKIHLKFGAIEHSVSDQNERLPKNSVVVVRQTKHITISVPLKLLNYPQKILTSIRVYLGVLPLDLLSWRALELSE